MSGGRDGEDARGGAGFLGRWSARKRASEAAAATVTDAVDVTSTPDVARASDADSELVPPVDGLPVDRPSIDRPSIDGPSMDGPSDADASDAVNDAAPRIAPTLERSDIALPADTAIDSGSKPRVHADGTPPTAEPGDEGAPPPTDADMPPLGTLDADSDLSPFFSRGVSAALRRAALRHVFALPRYNVRDGLNDYDGDYTKFVPLGDTVTSDMKFHAARLERLARERAERDAVSGAEVADVPAEETVHTPVPDGQASDGQASDEPASDDETLRAPDEGTRRVTGRDADVSPSDVDSVADDVTTDATDAPTGNGPTVDGAGESTDETTTGATGDGSDDGHAARDEEDEARG